MIDLYLWFSEDFEKRFSESRKKHDRKTMPEPFLIDRLEDERKNLLEINDEEDFQHEINKWKPLKIIVDAIYKELSPFADKDQSIKIDLSKLGIHDNVASPVLLSLTYERVCRWRQTHHPGIITNAPVIAYLSGEDIVVPSYEKFKEFRKAISDFYDFALKEIARKFPKNTMTVDQIVPHPPVHYQTLALKEVLKKDEEKQALKGEIVSELRESGKQEKGFEVNPPTIDYNPVTGLGKVNGTKSFKFKDGSPEHAIFNQLYAKMPKKLPRHDALIVGGFYKDYENPDPIRKNNETLFLNDKVKAMREKTGLTTEQLVNNAGNLTLVGKKSDKVAPK